MGGDILHTSGGDHTFFLKFLQRDSFFLTYLYFSPIHVRVIFDNASSVYER